VQIQYRVLERGLAPVEVTEDLTLGIRNGRSRPTRIALEGGVTDQKTGETHDLTIRVYDQNGKRLPGARVALKVDRGSVDTDAEITDALGEVSTSIGSEVPGTVTLTITVENLPPVTRVLRFVAPPPRPGGSSSTPTPAWTTRSPCCSPPRPQSWTWRRSPPWRATWISKRRRPTRSAS
jgi:hypothetical protein